MIGRYRATPRWVYWALIGATAFAIAGEGYGVFEVLSRRDEVALDLNSHDSRVHQGYGGMNTTLGLVPRRWTGGFGDNS